MLDLWEETYGRTFHLVETLRFDKLIELQRTLFALYATIIELNDSALIIMRNDRFAGVNSILRTCLEAYLDLVNLINDPGYLKFLHFEYHKQWRIVLEEGIKGTNQFLKVLQSEQATHEALARHTAKLEELKRDRVTALHIRDKFDKANVSDAYRGVYNELCADGHNNIRALINRHYHLYADGQFELQLFARRAVDDVEATIDAFTGILIGSALLMHTTFPSTEEAIPVFEELQSRRAQMVGV